MGITGVVRLRPTRLGKFEGEELLKKYTGSSFDYMTFAENSFNFFAQE
jgi:hypothetical protein